MSSEPSPDGESLSRRVVEALERNSAAFERNSAAFERHAAALDGQRDTFRVQAEIFEAGFRGLMEKLDDLGRDIRTNTQAILRLLDRFEGGPHPST